MDVSKTKDRAVLPKPKFIVYIGKSPKTFMNLTPTPKIALKVPKIAKKTPIMAKIKTKMGLYFHTIQVLSAFFGFVDDPVMYIPVYHHLGTWLLAIA